VLRSALAKKTRVLRLRVKDKHAKWLCGLAREVNKVCGIAMVSLASNEAVAALNFS
jgi:thiamine monophosphate synthase